MVSGQEMETVNRCPKAEKGNISPQIIVIFANNVFTFKFLYKAPIFDIFMMIKRPFYVKIAVIIVFAMTLLLSPTLFSQNLPLLPCPHQIIEYKGVFNMNEFVPVLRDKNAALEEQQAIWMLCEGYENIFGKPLKVTDKEKGSVIILRNLATETPSTKQGKMILPVGEEGYQLNIRPDKIEIIANSNAGLFYGSQTLLQLFRTSSLTGNINCMTINDMPSISKRYLCYDWDSAHVPSFNYTKQLIQCASHFKFNGIAFLNDSLSSPFAEMELFYLKKFAKTYYIDIVTNTRDFSDGQMLNINLKNKIYPEFQQTAKAVFLPFAKGENKMTVFHNNAAALFMDNWYSIFWTVELSWNQPKNNTPSDMKQRQTQYEKALDKQLFEVDFALCEELKSFDSLQIISLSKQDFWRSITTTGVSSAYNPANNQFVLTRALALEEKLQLLLESAPIAHDEIVYSMIFAAQRTGFIALKNLLQESLTQQSTEQETIQETVTILLENIRHLKTAHKTLWGIETDSAFPTAIAQKYEQMLQELEAIEF
jgi:hypothetical protein